MSQPETVDAASVIPHLTAQIGDLSLRLAAATALGERRHALAVSQAQRIAELEEQLREQAGAHDQPRDAD